MTEAEKTDIYLKYHKKVQNYIRGKTNDEYLAEDLASEVFVKIYEKLDTFDEGKASLSTWIFTITRNTLTDYFRSRRVDGEIPETLESGESVEDEYCDRETLENLAKGLESLDERERDVIILRFYSGMQLKDIAEKMGISYAYVKVIQNKAYAALKKYI